MVLTLMYPVPPAPTTALMLSGEICTNEAASESPNLTEVALARLEPVISTSVPGPPKVGVQTEMEGL